MKFKDFNFEKYNIEIKTPKISFYKSGYGNYIYLLEEKNNLKNEYKKKYIVKFKKKSELQFKDSLKKEFLLLKFFEEKKINFTPKVYYYNDLENFLIEEFIEGEEIRVSDFNDSEIDIYTKQLNKFFNQNVNEFIKFSKKHNFEIKVNDEIESLKIYGFNRFQEVNISTIGKRKYNLIFERLNENLFFLTRNKNDKDISKIGFNWGDVQGRVIKSSNKLFFFDFEHLQFSRSRELAYIKIHLKLTDENFRKLIGFYSKYSRIPTGKLYEQIHFEERIIRANDVVWAAMKYSKTNSENFLKILNKRIKLLENLKIKN